MEEQDPEEIPMDQVLSEIRHMLSDDNLLKKQVVPEHPSDYVDPPQTVQPVIASKPEPVEQENVPKKENDYFLLTPAMRCDLPSDSELSASVQQQAARVINKLQQKNPPQPLATEVEEWLRNNLPGMIERVLTEKLSEVHK
ncbi:MAG: hypothetical protein IJV07_05930 [Alphaproteobacteria bacterium]|nr:hypothetical protein [Alphaproteobacteria bacterium]